MKLWKSAQNTKNWQTVWLINVSADGQISSPRSHFTVFMSNRLFVPCSSRFQQLPSPLLSLFHLSFLPSSVLWSCRSSTLCPWLQLCFISVRQPSQSEHSFRSVQIERSVHVPVHTSHWAYTRLNSFISWTWFSLGIMGDFHIDFNSLKLFVLIRWQSCGYCEQQHWAALRRNYCM